MRPSPPPLTTHHSPLTTHHSPLTTHHSSPTTHQLITPIMIISLSLTAICREILAESALRHHLMPETPAPLTADSTDALRILVEAAFASLCVDLAPLIIESSVSDDGEILRLTFQGDPACASELRRSIEHLMALRVMSRAYASADPTLATTLSSLAAMLLRSLSSSPSLSQSRSSPVPVIPPCHY